MIVILLLLITLGISCHGEQFSTVRKDRNKGYRDDFKVEFDGKLVDLPLGYTVPGELRPPGTLLLNMLIKDERDHLARTLPKWAKVIDYWIIGVDDANTDDSPEIIQKHLGHIPGEIVIVHFDGMGPTWDILVKHGIRNYPEATHGIIADADFSPMVESFDKMELDIRCSKHMYTIWTEDHRNNRKMDWIYRNIPGVVMKRRTHQIIEVPELEGQEVFQTLINLPIEEREGGYQDRTGLKNERYIGFLEADLEDYPDDTRTLYYLGYAHFDIFQANQKVLTDEHWNHLAIGVDYFKKRASFEHEGNEEELWFTLLKLAEIYERFYQDWNTAEEYYKKCTEMDPDRADAWFYIGQHYRLAGDVDTALPYLHKAMMLPMPERSLFQWEYLYSCLSKIEYGRALLKIQNQLSVNQIKEAITYFKQANCVGGDPGNVPELKNLLFVFEKKAGGNIPKNANEKAFHIRNINLFWNNNIDDLELILDDDDESDAWEKYGWDDVHDVPYTLFSKLDKLINRMSAFRDKFIQIQKAIKADPKNEDLINQRDQHMTCRNYRRATTPYLRFFKTNAASLQRSLKTDNSLWRKWDKLTQRVRVVCR